MSHNYNQSSDKTNTDSTIRVVQLEGLVLLRILKHCRDNIPSVVSGQLLGIDIDRRLEISACFPSFSDRDTSEQDENTMKKCLRKVNVEHHIVGWYRSAFLGKFVTREVVETQYDYQTDIPNSVFIVFDLSRTTAGRLALQAFRLTNDFMSVYKRGDLGQSIVRQKGLDSRKIFQEVAIKVHNSHLIHAFLFELRELRTMSCDFDRLQLSVVPELHQNLSLLTECVDEYTQEQNTFAYFLRQLNRQGHEQERLIAKREQENEQRRSSGKRPVDEDLSRHPVFKPLPEPDRLESLLISHQMGQYCQQVNSAASMGFNKMFVTQGFHSDQQR